jgi:hypothetical protein
VRILGVESNGGNGQTCAAFACMKSAYELAMERLEKASPTRQLTDAQKAAIAEVEANYKAKIAEQELFLKEQIAKAASEGKYEETEQLEQQLAREIRRFQEECEAKKEKLRAEK